MILSSTMALLQDTGAAGEAVRAGVAEAFLHEVVARLPREGWTLSETPGVGMGLGPPGAVRSRAARGHRESEERTE